MSEGSVERLSRFTPAAGALDRDTLLFAAGRASARPNRAWIALAVGLVATQALTLVLLLWPSAPPAAPPPAAAAPPPAAPAPPVSPDSSESPGLWSVRHNLLEPEPEDRPAPAGGVLIESEPPLRAFAPPPPSILN